jgi:hypothetical protein
MIYQKMAALGLAIIIDVVIAVTLILYNQKKQ